MSQMSLQSLTSFIALFDLSRVCRLPSWRVSLGGGAREARPACEAGGASGVARRRRLHQCRCRLTTYAVSSDAPSETRGPPGRCACSTRRGAEVQTSATAAFALRLSFRR